MIEWTFLDDGSVKIELSDKELVETKEENLPTEYRKKAKGYFLAWALQEAGKIATNLLRPEYSESTELVCTIGTDDFVFLLSMEVTIKGTPRCNQQQPAK